MTWFDELTGFAESSARRIREQLDVDGTRMRSRANGRSFEVGHLETPNLAELRNRVAALPVERGTLSLQECVADVRELHAETRNAGALFQVASQFNLLEMAGPNNIPEEGVGRYERDRTQGPACAIAAGAGTIYRNYLMPVGDQLGQTEWVQIDCLSDLGAALGNTDQQLWTMRNGYALASEEGLIEISARLDSLAEHERDLLRQKLRIGLQWHTEVTLQPAMHRVTQAYCSALPVAYSVHAASLWEPFARLVLEASYEAALCAAVLNAQTTGNRCVYLTLLGCGAFGNRSDWIFDSLHRALRIVRNDRLDVYIVSYRSSQPEVAAFVADTAWTS